MNSAGLAAPWRSTIINATGHLVDSRVGIIRNVHEVGRQPGAPDFFHVAATACNTAAFTRLENFGGTGGAAVTREAALGKALGEAVERYCSAIFDVNELPLCCYDEAGFTCADPDSFALYSARQYADPDFPWRPFDRRTPVRWAPARRVLTGATVYVPAVRLYVPYVFYQASGDTPIDQPISTGLAAHGCYAAAALGAICEVVERDAVTIVWQAMVAPPRIDPQSLPPQVADVVARFEDSGAAVRMFNITLDHGIPAILSVMLGSARGDPALVVAGSASLDPVDAAIKSLEELAHTRRYSAIIQQHLPRLTVAPPAHANVGSQVDHLNFWADHGNVSHAEWLLAPGGMQPFAAIENLATGDVEADLRLAAERVEATGEQVLVADLTTPDIRQLGLSVARAVIPGYHPLHLGHPIRALGGSRLWRIPQRFGYAGISPSSGDNPWPHPYP